MPVLDDAGVGHIARGVVDDGIALVLLLVEFLRLKADAAVLERAEAVSEELVDAAGVDDPLRDVRFCLNQIEVIRVQANLHALEHVRHHLRVAADRDALPAVVEVVVVVGEAARQALDDECRQIPSILPSDRDSSRSGRHNCIG